MVLDGQLRQWYPGDGWMKLERPALMRLGRLPEGRWLLAAISCHRNGHLRELAMRLLAGAPQEGWEAAFYALRINDWAVPVRVAAREAQVEWEPSQAVLGAALEDAWSGVMVGALQWAQKVELGDDFWRHRRLSRRASVRRHAYQVLASSLSECDWLEALAEGVEGLRERAESLLRRWLARGNRRQTPPGPGQREACRAFLARSSLSDKMRAELEWAVN